MIRLPKVLAAIVVSWALLFSAWAAAAVNPPILVLAFGGPTAPLNGFTAVTYFLLNANASDSLTNVHFTNNLPAGLVIADPSDPNVPSGPTNTCNNGGTPGALVATPNTTTITYTGATIAPGSDPNFGNCAVTVYLKATTLGNITNSVRAGSDQGDSLFFKDKQLLTEPSTATVLVLGPATVKKEFGAASIVTDHTTSLKFTLSNSNSVALEAVAFADGLTDGLVVATPNGVSGNTCGGTIQAGPGSPGTPPILFTGGTVPANGSCSFSLNVLGTSPGVKHNVTTGTYSGNGGLGTQTAAADLLVIAPPVAFKQFFDSTNPSDPTTPLNGQAILFIAMVNVNDTVSLHGAGFTDTLPPGLVVAQPPYPPIPGGTNTCNNGGTPGTVVAIPGSSTVTYSGATIAPGVQPDLSNCVVIVFLTGTTPGDKLNTVTATSTDTGPGKPATASILVVAPPTATKSFASAFVPPSLALNETTALTFTVSNSNRVDLQGVAIGDALPVGLIIATPNGAAGNICGGTLTADAGTSLVVLSGATVPAKGSCTFSVNVTGTTAGTKDNTTTEIFSANGGNGPVTSATLYVVAPPVIAKQFGAASIVHQDTTTLTITITNPPENTIPVTGVGFTDILPPGLMIAAPNGLTGSCYGGTITATQWTRVLALSGAAIPVGSSCTFTVKVVGTAQDTVNVNLTSQVISDNGGKGNTATATLKVVPRIIPTLQEWALVLLSLLLALSAFVVLRRRGGDLRS